MAALGQGRRLHPLGPEPLQRRRHLPRLQRTVDAVGAGGVVGGGGSGGRGTGGRPPLLVDHQVAGHREEPGPQRAGAGIEAVELAPGPQEGLLDDVLGPAAIAQRPLRVGEQGGAVLGVETRKLRLWVPGLTPESGTTIDLPRRFPGWLCRDGATFDVTGAGDLADAEYRFQARSWMEFESTNRVEQDDTA